MYMFEYGLFFTVHIVFIPAPMYTGPEDIIYFRDSHFEVGFRLLVEFVDGNVKLACTTIHAVLHEVFWRQLNVMPLCPVG